MSSKTDKILAKNAKVDWGEQRCLVRRATLLFNRAERIKKNVDNKIYPTPLAAAQALKEAHADTQKAHEITNYLRKHGTPTRGPRLA